jgi:hypothetical protein
MAETIGLLILTAVSASEVGGIAGLGTIAGTTIAGVSVATIVGTGVLIGGAYAINAALGGPTEGQSDPSNGQVTTKQPVPPRTRHYGIVRVSGPIMFLETLPSDGSLPTSLNQIIAVNHGQIESFEEVWLNEINCITEPPISAGGGQVTNAYTLGGSKFVQVNLEKGTPTDAGFSLLHSLFPAVWDASHQGKGIAKALMAYFEPAPEDFTSVYTGGQPPALRVTIKASRVWDPRVVGQDKDNPATWTWTRNPILIALDYHRHADGMRLAHLDSVLFTLAALNEDWIPAVNICDEAVPLAAGGVEARYLCGGGYELPTAAPKDVLGAIFATCDGQSYQRPDGAIGVRVGKTVAPTVTIGDDHILGYDGFRKGDNAFTAVNEITAQYTSPENDWQTSDAMAWRDEDDISERGQVLTANLILYWVQSHPQARRLMKIEMHRRNPEWQGRIITDLYGLNAYNERFLHLTISELGIDGSFEIIGFEIDTGAGTCAITVSAFDQSAYDWDPATEEGEPPPVPPASAGMAMIAAPTGLSASSGVQGRREVRAVGDPVNIVISWDAEAPNPAATARAQIKLSNADEGGWFAANVQSSNAQAITAMVPSGESYDVRVAWRVGTRDSDWTLLEGIIA